jgi:SAM-dependent methyltransferase
MHVIRRITCRACGCLSLKPAVDLGEQHLQGSFVKTGAVAPMRKVPMRLVRCNPLEDENACGLLQTEFTVPPQMMYHTYWYRSGTNATMRNHLKSIVTEVMSIVEGPKTVLDIGCNDGTLLGYYPEEITKWGVDPSNIAAQAQVSPGIEIINDFFPSPAVMAQVGDIKFDIVTAIAMFYDLEKPTDFVKEVERVLTDDGVFVFEMSHLPAMIRQNSYDTICHEHIEYYSLAAIEKILALAGMRVAHISENDINGGSIRVTAVKAASKIPTDETVTKMRIAEFELKLDTDEPYVDFQKRADLHRTDLIKLLKDLKSKGKTIHVYGASTKGNTLLQWCGIDTKLVDYAADRNPDKSGARTPGSDIPIISETESRKMKPNYYLVLPWHFRDEFIEREKDAIMQGTQFIFPLPEIKIVGG